MWHGSGKVFGASPKRYPIISFLFQFDLQKKNKLDLYNPKPYLDGFLFFNVMNEWQKMTDDRYD